MWNCGDLQVVPWRFAKELLTAEIVEKRCGERRVKMVLFFFASSTSFLCDLCGQRLLIAARFPLKTAR
jgi:hypothetical protein